MPTLTATFAGPKWDLDSVFPGGSGSVAFEQFRKKTRSDLDKAIDMIKGLPATLNAGTAAQWIEFILKFQELLENIDMIRSFGGCLTSQDVSDAAARSIVAEGDLYFAEWEKLKAEFEGRSLKQNARSWERLVSSAELKGICFFLNEMRRLAKEKMPVALESLALELGVNGFHAWNRLYEKMAGDLLVDFEEDGGTKTISLGQLSTKMSDPNRDVRARAFAKVTEAWESRADLAAMTLNSMAGFRLTLFSRRGWGSALHEPLNLARLRQETLDTMWKVVAQEVPRLAPYIEAKKRLLGIDRFRWYDEHAPCGRTDRKYSFDEAGKLIVDADRNFSSEMADFVRMALDKRWIEAEDRPGKAGGGYCTRFRPFKQGRIFMTYAGTYDNLLTLAHELGHLYHGRVLKDHPPFAAEYPMTLAETASIFNEMLVTDAALSSCRDPQEKVMLLEQRLQAAYTMFCNIRCRYLFERAFYEERAKGVVSRDRLDELMVNAQKEAYCGMLDVSGYHPLFWASKMHFFLSELGFYNFPYTFGFLFAGGVYDRAKREGPSFAEKYRALLADTGRMTTEEVAEKHLGVDLTREEFWISAVDRSLAEVDEFVRLADSL